MPYRFKTPRRGSEVCRKSDFYWHMTNRGRQWHEGLSGLLPAETALRRLVVMTPFIDASGFRWLPRMLETTHANCQRIIVLRNADQYTVELGVQHGDWLRAMQVSVRDYHLSHYPRGGARFADRDIPRQGCRRGRYARLCGIGQPTLFKRRVVAWLEMGLLVEGGAAAQVARLVDAVLFVAWAL
jgi:hypothetical protein